MSDGMALLLTNLSGAAGCVWLGAMLWRTTTENLARWICDHVDKAYKVEVWESEMNMAAYER